MPARSRSTPRATTASPGRSLSECSPSTPRTGYLNLVSGLAAVSGALAGDVWLARLHRAVPCALGISAATFLYRALVDLRAGFHRRLGAALAVKRVVALIAGVATIGSLVSP